jgi:hypothetical protein
MTDIYINSVPVTVINEASREPYLKFLSVSGTLLVLNNVDISNQYQIKHKSMLEKEQERLRKKLLPTRINVVTELKNPTLTSFSELHPVIGFIFKGNLTLKNYLWYFMYSSPFNSI